ncbi:hypothetical protein S40285_02050 [Stachybotrys chlorohalonatus IBT 40285]|uniref:Transcription regulator Rua1 C-terminal domain-containing protein n=1 Tax=Stachybotrys chlorohalonatus (strain IBT 40285) TaxID=1283841 RepID=A0A084R1D5_STAC4|nr:hypothetical protein S40285_02050 [Stachybotrys chlorohalonata IBT 40285]
MDSAQIQSQQQYQTPSFIFTNNDTSINSSPQPSSIYNMDENDLSKQEEVATPNNVWTTPTSQPRPRPATIHEGFSYCLSDDFSSLQSWDSPSLSIEQTPSDIMSRPVSMHQEMFPPITHDKNFWDHKPYGSYGMHGFDSEMPIGQAYTTDEAIPVLDLKFNSVNEPDAVRFEGHVDVDPRRISGSSFTMSTSGALSDLTSCDDFSTALSEAPSYSSDYRPTSNRNSLMSSTHLSPVASPRMTPHGRTELVRTQSRGRASPSPRPHARSAPYSVEVARNKRWSTGSYGNVSNRRVPQPYMYNGGHDAFLAHQPHAPFLVAGPSIMQRNSMLLPSQLPSQQLPSQPLHHDHHHLEPPAPLLSHGLFRMLQSNGDPHSLHGHFTDLSDPPDLFASLHEEQIPPPPEDMNPSDPDMIPHEQELRFEGDLYTPRWVRGHGNKREGWCGICKPGRWLVLKNSAYWYDKSFTHGISAATGNPFQEPQDTRRMDGNPDVWEGLCGSCNEWIALVSSKKKGTTWFRHAYKCHTHTKVKDAPKRRRESSNSRSLAASNMARPKPDPSTTTPAPTSASAATVMPQLPPPQHHHLVHVPQPQIMGLEASYPNMI